MKKLALSLATLAFSAAAAAGDPVFRFSPDDLTTLERIAATHERIEVTAQDYCREHLKGTRGVQPWRTCVSAVVDEIVGSIDDKRLTAYAETGTVDDDLLAAVSSVQKRS